MIEGMIGVWRPPRAKRSDRGGGGGGVYPPPTVGTFPKIMSTKIVSTKKAVENEILGI